MTTKIFVVSGVTSSLFVSLLPYFRYSVSQIVGLVRHTDDISKLEHIVYLRSCGVEIITQSNSICDDITIFFNTSSISPAKHWRFLWLSTHDDAQTLRYCANMAPTLAIGSGIMIDYYNGKVDLTKAPKTVVEYIQGKLRMALTPNVTTLCPGFFLEDDPSTRKTPGGLHRESTLAIFSNELLPTFDWGKPKYVTPKSFLAECIMRWYINPTPHLGKWYHCGSELAYHRWQLRQMSGFEIALSIKQAHQVDERGVYYNDYSNVTKQAFGIMLTEAQVKDACLRTRQWVESHKSK